MSEHNVWQYYVSFSIMLVVNIKNLINTCLLLILLLLPVLAFAENADLVLVNKAQRKLSLFNSNKLIAEYSIALGGEPVGPKRCQGDSKTPEGEYIIESRNSKSAFYKSLKVSYPNSKDQITAKELNCSPGGDIMIHGLPNGRGWLGAAHRLTDWTLGCIALTNSEIDQIWQIVQVGTRVRIEP